MKVYIDLLILINFIFDLILLLSVNYILRRNAKLIRILLGSLLGEVTFLILFININNFILFIFKVIISVLMLIISFGYRDLKYITKNTMYFYLVSMLLGGGIDFLNNQFSYSNEGLIFNNKGLGISYGLVILVSLFIFFKYVKSFNDFRSNYSNYYRCKIYFDKYKFLEVNAFLDTGNKLKDPYSNKSIILINKDKLDLMEKNNPIYVPYNSLNNHGLLTCYKALKLQIDGKEYDKFLIGVSEENFFMDGIDCIINNNVMEGLR